MNQADINAVLTLMTLGDPYVKPRTESDYWLYAKLFSSTTPLTFIDGQLVGVIVAFRSQDNPSEIYVQDVMVRPNFRRRGVATELLNSVIAQGQAWDCRRLFLTSEPENNAAHVAWLSYGFENLPGNMIERGVQVQSDYKGPGKHRAIYEYRIVSPSRGHGCRERWDDPATPHSSPLRS
ncbi:GNAT family N-acetyltransferase [Micromonospora globispora]|nr:GNAT family N-acetyltransferase [Micromonospora globispora]